jgi:protein SCO1
MPPRLRLIVSLASGALVLALALVLLLRGGSSGTRSANGPSAAVNGSGASGFDGAALPANLTAPDFTLVDQSGHAVSLSGQRGAVTVLAFLSSSCASCTLIAQQVRGALDELTRPATVLFVSADPTADTRASVERFLAGVSLSGRARYLTGPRERLASIWRAYRLTPPARARGAFERAATVMLIDRSGFERVLFGVEQLTPEGLAHDIGKLQTG